MGVTTSSPRPSGLDVCFGTQLAELGRSSTLPIEEMMREWPLTTACRRLGARIIEARKHRQFGCGKYGNEWQC